MTLLGSGSAGAPKRLFEPADFRRPFLILWAIFVLFYFSELAGFSLSIDDEYALLRTDPAVWLAQDRWLAYLIERFILPPPVLPFFPLFVFGALASLGYIVVAKCHDRDLADWRVLLLFVLFSAFPALFFLLDFSFVLPSFGVALLLACISLFLFDRAMDAMAEPGDRRGRLIGLFALQALLGAGAIGVYQSLILLVAAGCCGIFLLRYLRGPALPLRHILILHAYLLGALIASIALSYLVAYGLQGLTGQLSTYTARFVRPDRLVESPWTVIQKMLAQYWEIYGGKRAVYGFRYVTFPALLVLGMAALAARAWHRGRLVALLVILYMLGMTLIPFAINPLSGGRMPYRTLVSVPYVFWFFAAAVALSPIVWLRRVGIALVIVVALQCLYTFSSFQAQKRLVLDHDRQLASQIYQRIVAEVPDFDRTRTYQVEFYGEHKFRSRYKEVDRSTWCGLVLRMGRRRPEPHRRFHDHPRLFQSGADRRGDSHNLVAGGRENAHMAGGGLRASGGWNHRRPARPAAGRHPSEGNGRAGTLSPSATANLEPNACVSSPGTSTRCGCASTCLRRLVKEEQPDVICLQEIKVQDSEFPEEALKAMGYPHILRHGMKSYNGVAILSRLPFLAKDPQNWCDKGNSRHGRVVLGGDLDLQNFYVPAGGDIPNPKKNVKFAHKLQFLDEMQGYFKTRREQEALGHGGRSQHRAAGARRVVAQAIARRRQPHAGRGREADRHQDRGQMGRRRAPLRAGE